MTLIDGSAGSLQPITGTKEAISSSNNNTIREKIMGYQSCIEWLQTVRSECTREGHIYQINKFCDFHGTTPDETAKLSSEQLKMLAIKYILHLKKVAKKTARKPVHGEIFS